MVTGGRRALSAAGFGRRVGGVRHRRLTRRAAAVTRAVDARDVTRGRNGGYDGDIASEDRRMFDANETIVRPEPPQFAPMWNGWKPRQTGKLAISSNLGQPELVASGDWRAQGPIEVDALTTAGFDCCCAHRWVF